MNLGTALLKLGSQLSKGCQRMALRTSESQTRAHRTGPRHPRRGGASGLVLFLRLVLAERSVARDRTKVLWGPTKAVKEGPLWWRPGRTKKRREPKLPALTFPLPLAAHSHRPEAANAADEGEQLAFQHPQAQNRDVWGRGGRGNGPAPARSTRSDHTQLPSTPGTPHDKGGA